MALAIIEPDRSDPSGRHFRFDIGKNRYYSVVIGQEEHRNEFGVATIDQPSHVTPVLGPIPDSSMGRGRFELPAGVHTEPARVLQLLSYRDRDKNGPAISSIVRLPRHIPKTEAPLGPAVPWQQESMMQSVHSTRPPKQQPWVEQQLSEAQFLGALTNMLPSILPAIGNMVGGLFGSGSSNSSTTSGSNPLAALTNPETIQQIVQLLNQFNSGTSDGAATAAPSAAASPGAEAAPQAQALSRALTEHPAEPLQVSQAMVAPALLAALPALMPVLQQVLSPQTVQSIIQAPQRSVGQIINGFKDMAKLGIQSHEQDLRHLRELNPGVDDPALNQLLLSMSSGLRQMDRDPRYKRVPSVRLTFSDISSHTISGTTTVAYKRGRPLSFPIAVETPKNIRKTLIEVTVKHAQSLKVVHRKRQTTINVKSGPLSGVPSVPAGVFDSQPSDAAQFIVCVTLMWKNRTGEKRGTSVQQTIRLVDNYIFDSVRESSNLFPLTNASIYRAFWHKVWERSFTKASRRLDFNLRYTYGLSPAAPENERLRTTSTMKVKRRELSGRLSTGMDLSLTSLNQLLSTLSPELSPIDANVLSALKAPEFAERVNQRATHRVQMRGRPGQTAAIWVYPEVKLQEVLLRRPTAVNDNGNVTALDPVSIRFPVPALIHVVGVLSE